MIDRNKLTCVKYQTPTQLFPFASLHIVTLIFDIPRGVPIDINLRTELSFVPHVKKGLS